MHTTLIADVIEKMIRFYHGNYHDISHSLNVYTLAKTIGEQEGLDPQAQQTLELAAAVHDIASPMLPPTTTANALTIAPTICVHTPVEP